MRSPRLRSSILALAMLAPVAGLHTASAMTSYVAGASAVKITPPRTGTFVGSLCPALGGPRIFDFEEPYRDSDGDGRYEVGEPFCDANANGRYDGIYVVGQVDHPAANVMDDIWVRTFVVGDGTHKFIAISSVDSLGLFDTDVQTARSGVLAEHPNVADIIVSADHNESSPDSVGLWGPTPSGGSDLPASTTSGVNDYYMDFLAQQIAASVTQALAAAQPANLSIMETTAPTIVPTLNHWPTTNRKDGTSASPNPQTAGRIDAWDPKVGILQAKDAAGATIFTVVNYAAHIQNMGHSGAYGNLITADWVRYFNTDVEAGQGGVAIYLQSANGSIETPQVPSRGSPAEYTLARSQAIGEELAAVVNAAVPGLEPLGAGDVAIARQSFTIPLENQLFIAAFGAHLFPHKTPTVAADGSPYPHVQTEVGSARIGPLQLLANPGEAFPALTKGSHWGVDEGCSERANPPVPSWATTAPYRWDVGLADDMIGYELPAWGWGGGPEAYANITDPCVNGNDDGGNHSHGLEDESTGPSGANVVAAQLAAIAHSLSDAGQNTILVGRYLFADGTLSRRPYKAPYARDGVVGPTVRAIGIVAGGRVFMIAPNTHVGSYVVTDPGAFVDFDGRVQNAADQTTRGFRTDSGETVFVDVYPAV